MACSQFKRKSESHYFFKIVILLLYLLICLLSQVLVVAHRLLSSCVLGLGNCDVGLVALSETDDQTGAPCIVAGFLTTEPPGKSLSLSLLSVTLSEDLVVVLFSKLRKYYLISALMNFFIIKKVLSVGKCFLLYQLM